MVNNPNIRFAGFSDEWEERKLGDFVVDYVEKTTRQNQYPVLTSSQQKGIVLQEDYFANRQVTTDNNIGYFVLPMGYFTFRSRSDNDVFVFNRNDLIDKGIISYFYPVFTLKDADSDFFLKRINNGIQRQIAIAAEGTGQHVLSLKKFKNIIAIFPCLEEQQKIGSVFSALDHKIGLEERQISLLKDLKKGYLQKMFPKQGATEPEIRFKGFADDWEERKLGDVLSERNDQTPETNEYPLMSFVQGKGVTPKGERYDRSFLVKDSEKKYKKTELGDFIYSSNNLETGSIGFNRTGKAVISPVYSIFKSKKSRESQFIGIMSARKDFISKMVRFRQGVVYGQWRIHESDFLNIDMKMPNDKEQQLIISFFEKIDDTIAHHQRKLDSLKDLKKGLLQQMFV